MPATIYSGLARWGYDSDMATSLNHVSIGASDLEASARFYVEVLGLERIPSPNFGTPTCWLRAGDLQLHLFERSVTAPTYHHFGLTVQDFEGVYRKVEQLGLMDTTTMGAGIRELPDNSVQMYLRDPAGNLVEVDFPDSSHLDSRVIGSLPKLADEYPQSEENRRASLFLGPGR